MNSFEQECRRLIPAARMGHKLKVVFGGVSVLVPEDQIEDLYRLQGVKAVYADPLLSVDTNRSPKFIGADKLWKELGGQESAGEGVIVGILDTGIWPEHPSYSDPDPLGNPYAPPPAKWTGTACEFGSLVPGDDSFICNNKLIGAARFIATYDSVIGLTLTEFDSARDDDGHGTHTSSTAAGNAGTAASYVFGAPDIAGVSGVAPRAHVVMYRV